MQSRTSLNGRSRRLRALAMPGNPWQVPLLRPAPIPVHDHRDVPRQPFQVQFFEQMRFFGGHRSERASRMCARASHVNPNQLPLCRKVNTPLSTVQRAFLGELFLCFLSDHSGRSQPGVPFHHCARPCPTRTKVNTIMATAVIQATMLNDSVLVCSPIKSLRFTRSRIKITTIGSHTPLPTCEKMKIFHSGAFGSSTMPAPTTIKIVYSQ